MAAQLSAIILAAGLSSRMGELKALLPLGDAGNVGNEGEGQRGERTVLEQCLTLFRQGGVEDLTVVTGHRADEVGAVAALARARLVHNPDFASGMYSSIRAGASALPDQCSGFFLLPVDLSLVRCGTIKLLTRSFAQAPARIVYPVFAGRRGHPPLLAPDLIPAIIQHEHPQGGLRTLLAQVEAEQPELVREVQVADANIHFDMDTPEDFLVGRRLFGRRAFPTMAECQAILDYLHPMPTKGLAHGRMVAEVAGALCEAINRRGELMLDPELCRVCGWLHDIAKGSRQHEEQGARWLRDLGFDRAAAIVAAHKDLPWTIDMVVSEREIVHLADKLVRGSRIVDISTRFEEKLTLYQDDPAAVRAIRSRFDQALRVGAAVEAEAGQTLEVITEMAFAACSR
jgi:putative nucleotidyltransferase with HDIG domain